MRDIRRNKNLSNNDKAVRRVADVIRNYKKVMVAYSALDRTNVTVGPYRTAVAGPALYAVTLRGNINPFSDAENAAEVFVATVGSTRALGAVIDVVGQQQNKEYINAGT